MYNQIRVNNAPHGAQQGKDMEQNNVTLKVKRLDPDAVLPKYATDGAACFDLRALVPDPDGILVTGAFGVLKSGERWGGPKTIRTGLAFEVPPGHVMLIYSRSGHGFNHDIRLANCVGVIDADYRGEVMVRLTSDQDDQIMVKHGDRIAQAMLVPIPRVALVEVDELSATARGDGGFGSTGV